MAVRPSMVPATMPRAIRPSAPSPRYFSTVSVSGLMEPVLLTNRMIPTISAVRNDNSISFLIIFFSLFPF